MSSIAQASEQFKVLKQEISKVIVGQEDIITFITIAILCEGHILLEGLPGVAKTTIVKAISNALGLHFSRIQFTPDLLPSDLIGSLIFNQKIQDFEAKKGPIFANLILADEINRAPAKVQAALLEAMQEKQVTIGSDTFLLDKPFLVFATQNPVEQEGTYRLPEAQIDRFMFKLLITYPKKEQEKEILSRNLDTQSISQVLTREDILQAQAYTNQIYMDSKIIDYIVDIIFATRSPETYQLKKLSTIIQYGVSPRATLALRQASKAHAFLQGRDFVTPDDVKKVAPSILRHRLVLTYHAEVERINSYQVIEETLLNVPTP
jgi:MoxR-like ATPase